MAITILKRKTDISIEDLISIYNIFCGIYIGARDTHEINYLKREGLEDLANNGIDLRISGFVKFFAQGRGDQTAFWGYDTSSLKSNDRSKMRRMEREFFLMVKKYFNFKYANNNLVLEGETEPKK